MPQQEKQMYHTIWTKIPRYKYLISIEGQLIRLERTRNQWNSFAQKKVKTRYPTRYVFHTSARKGYMRYTISKKGKLKRFFAHRMVLMLFSKVDPERLYVNHINGIHNDNRLENLEWVTPSENEQHSFRVLGKKVHNRKLTDLQVREIRASQLPSRAVAKQYGVNKTTILNIRKRKFYAINETSNESSTTINKNSEEVWSSFALRRAIT